MFWGAFLKREPEGHAANQARLLALVSEGRLSAKVHGVYPLEEAASALGILARREAMGRSCCGPEAPSPPALRAGFHFRGGNGSRATPFTAELFIPERQDGDTVGDIIRIILLVVIPPIGVLFTVGFGLQFILNVVLTLFGYIPA